MYRKIRSWFKHKIWDKKTYIKIPTLDPGYYDTDTRMLHGMFSLLVDYVEIEHAWILFYFDYDKVKLNMTRIEHFLAKYFGIIRSPELGLQAIQNYIDNFEGIEKQSETYTEVLYLYRWWKIERSNRQTPEELSGLDKFFDDHREALKFRFHRLEDGLYKSYNHLTKDEDEEFHRLCVLSSEIEDNQYKEDNEMLKRLIDIRGCLWT